MSPSGITSMRVRSMPAPCAHSMRRGNSSSLTPLSATALILTARPAGLRRRHAVQHLVEIAPARHGAELVGIERVERDVDPLDAVARELGGVFRAVASRWWSASARRARPRQGAATASATSVMIPRRTNGSPPVSRSLRTPLAMKAVAQPVQLFEREHVAPWAGTSCPPPCSRRSGSRSGRSPTRADR